MKQINTSTTSNHQRQRISRIIHAFALILACFLLQTSLSADYIRPSHVPEEIWDKLSPYFLPENSPIKPVLDETFSKRRVLQSLYSLRKSGFFILTDPKDKIIVAKHINIHGYLIKVYLDGMKGDEWDCWLRRVRGSKVIQDGINLHGYQWIMKVPKKWVYPLPEGPRAKTEINEKNFVLVVEEMDILSHIKNRSAYKKKVTLEVLRALYTMLTEYLLIDSVYADNTTFCKDGRLAFVDTEYTGDTTQPVGLSAIGQYLNSEMVALWEQFLVHGLQ